MKYLFFLLMNFYAYSLFLIIINSIQNANCQEYTFLYSNIEDDLTSIKETDFGHLTGDVQNWAAIIQNYILQVKLINILV